MKTTFNLLTLCLALLLTSTSYADNQLTLGEGVNVLAINGKTPDKIALLKTRGGFTLRDGKNQLLISYTAEFKRNGDFELEESHPTVITFEAANKNIAISAPQIRNERAFLAFNTQQNWNITANQTVLSYEAEQLPLKGFRLGVDYELELARFNGAHPTAALIITPDVTHQDVNSEQKLVLKMLNFWMKMATPETKNAFLKQAQ